MLFYAKIDLEISEETGLDNLCPEEIIEMYVLERVIPCSIHSMPTVSIPTTMI